MARGCIVVVGLAALLLVIVTLLGRCSSHERPISIAKMEGSAGVAPAQGRELDKADQERVCRAAIADMNGHPPRIVRVVNSSKGVVRVRYTRPSDGKVWTNDCRVEGDRVVWRTVDAFGRGSGLGRWRTHPADEVITYTIADDQLSITTTFPGEPPSTETYTLPR